MGGVVPGGFSLTKRNVYETGLVLSPRALYKAGEPVRETWSLIFDNVALRGDPAPGHADDLAGLGLGERLLNETIERYGLEAVHGAMSYVCDARRSACRTPSRRSRTGSGRARTGRLRRRRRHRGVPRPCR